MQDGKARALQAAMIDDEFYVHQIHLQKKTSKSKNLSPKVGFYEFKRWGKG